MAGPSGDRGLMDSWLVTRHEDGAPTSVKLVLSLAAGNVFISPDINPADVTFTGTWASRRGRKFKATMWTGFPGETTGEAAPTARVRVRGSQAHDTISGTYDFAIFDPIFDPVSDQVIASVIRTFAGSRIEA